MLQDEKEFSPRDSLQLIQSMIETTRHSMNDRSHYFLLWGWAVFIGCLLQYWLKVIVEYPKHYYAWYITLVAVIIHFWFIMRDRKKEKVKTYISDAFKYLWIAIGSSFIVLGFLFSNIGWEYCYPFYILFYAIGTFISGSLIKFKPLIIGGLICFPLAAITSKFDFDHEIIMLALAIIISYIIPGYLLRLHYQKQSR